jgi:hypothetical protein
LAPACAEATEILSWKTRAVEAGAAVSAFAALYDAKAFAMRFRPKSQPRNKKGGALLHRPFYVD